VALLARSDDAGEDLSGSELRLVVQQAWQGLCSIVDRTIASGRFFDRGVLIELGRWLDTAMPAVRAYERLMALLSEEVVLPVELDRPRGLQPVAEEER
jgi:hypothetical protein